MRLIDRPLRFYTLPILLWITAFCCLRLSIYAAGIWVWQTDFLSFLNVIHCTAPRGSRTYLTWMALFHHCAPSCKLPYLRICPRTIFLSFLRTCCELPAVRYWLLTSLLFYWKITVTGPNSTENDYCWTIDNTERGRDYRPCWTLRHLLLLRRSTDFPPTADHHEDEWRVSTTSLTATVFTRTTDESTA